MARIRSIHPGLLTDEGFMALGHAAFRLYMGLLMEADDQGIFEWKPITLKARILPAHNDDTIVLLAELSEHKLIGQFQEGAKLYGAIRNFMKYQRPRRPAIVHPLNTDMAAFVGRPPVRTAPVPVDDGSDAGSGDDIPDNVGKVSADGGGRMEEEGGRRKEVKYKFKGEIIKLSARDHERWRSAYSAIPDLDAELQRIDDRFQAKHPDNWFQAASAMLAAKHQKLAALQAQPPPRTRITPLGVGG